jgi:hypothetical protein
MNTSYRAASVDELKIFYREAGACGDTTEAFAARSSDPERVGVLRSHA